MTWQTEFGPEWDVPAIDLPDQSWHNDACPSFGHADLLDAVGKDYHDLRLWVDHVDPEQRELGGIRYCVNYMPYSNEPVPGVVITDYGQLYEGDDLPAALAAYEQARQTITAELARRRTTTHEVTLHNDIESPSDARWSADCVCGWSSGTYETADEAEADGNQHVAEDEQHERVAVDKLLPGDRLDMGIFAALEPGLNAATVTVRLADGACYSETAGATVRVWERAAVSA